uniref:Uncharacterized protein AlNc14C39G3361 n=1 Tax=Albugo laibachii Nc14 TaxID=890382 RepID=F0W994_9STRA|nr:conserved hypothetical protein [Albugo laibachii Nc14]CCA18353.1 conserved hypothetical protein [Albugo laibachii Nc14]|eukprot:CCA18353.1 conserved hypothetical protein [Albugo laibachii Nc14]
MRSIIRAKWQPLLRSNVLAIRHRGNDFMAQQTVMWYHIVKKKSWHETEKLKGKILEIQSTIESSLDAFQHLRSLDISLGSRYYAVLLAKLQANSDYSQIKRVLQEKRNDERIYECLTLNTYKIDFLQLCRFRMLLNLHEKDLDKVQDCFDTCLRGRHNKLGIYEEDPYNLLLRLECVFPFPSEKLENIFNRIKQILAVMDRNGQRISFSASHTLARFIFGQPKSCLAEFKVSHTRELDAEGVACAGVVIKELFSRYPTLFEDKSWLVSQLISDAACASDRESCLVLVGYAQELNIPISESVFGHLLRLTQIEDSVVDKLYADFKSRDAVCPVRSEAGRPGQRLLHSAVTDRDFYRIMVLLHEMEHYKVEAHPSTLITLLKAVSTHRQECHDAKHVAGTEKEIEPGCPSILELFQMFPFVFGDSLEAAVHGIRLSAMAKEYEGALKILRSRIWTRDMQFPKILFASFLYISMRTDRISGEMVGDVHPRESILVEIQQLYELQHGKARYPLYGLIARHCEYRDDFETFLQFLDRWQRSTPIDQPPALSPKASKRALRYFTRQLYKLRETADQRNDVRIEDEEVIITFLKRYDRVFVWNRRNLSDLLLISDRLGYRHGVLSIFDAAVSTDLVLSLPANATVLKTFLALENQETKSGKCKHEDSAYSCQLTAAIAWMQKHGQLDEIFRLNPDVNLIKARIDAIDASENQKLNESN